VQKAREEIVAQENGENTNSSGFEFSCNLELLSLTSHLLLRALSCSQFFFFLIKCKKYIDQKVRLAGKPASQKYKCTEQAYGNKLPTSTRITA
jgi:hypothetical protein